MRVDAASERETTYNTYVGVRRGDRSRGTNRRVPPAQLGGNPCNSRSPCGRKYRRRSQCGVAVPVRVPKEAPWAHRCEPAPSHAPYSAPGRTRAAPARSHLSPWVSTVTRHLKNWERRGLATTLCRSQRALGTIGLWAANRGARDLSHVDTHSAASGCRQENAAPLTAAGCRRSLAEQWAPGRPGRAGAPSSTWWTRLTPTAPPPPVPELAVAIPTIASLDRGYQMHNYREAKNNYVK